MARRGRLSRGCHTCRKRKIKCDQVRPACGQCLKAGWTCPQYADSVERMFQYQDASDFTKIRRVKCDERNHCRAKCHKFGADCESYEVGGQQNAPSTSSVRETCPRKNHPALLSPSLGKLPFNAVFHDHQEYSYFLYFQEKAAVDIAGVFDRNLWTHVIIQASWTESSLRQLVASLGALYKAESPNALNLSKEETGPHRQYAFQQYGRSLKSIQARISGNQYRDTTRIALIASLLIYCFESIYGELSLALGHLEGALQLMHKQLAHAGCHYKHSENKSPTSALDDDLVAAFFRLDSGMLSRDEIGDADTVGSRLGMHHLENISEVPERFNTLSEARNILENIQFPSIPSLSRDLLRKIDKPPLPGNIDEKARDMYIAMSSQLRRWHIAFAPLYAEFLTPNSENFIAAATLRVRALSTELASQRVCTTELSSHYLLNPKSHQIVNLSKGIAADPSFLKSFVWDCGIVPGLSIVIAACLDMSIRKEALQLLKQIAPRREGVWDSLTAVKFGERCLQME